MKNLILIPVLLIFASSSQAQSATTWFPPGAQLAYYFESLGGPGHEYIEYVGPDVKAGQNCIKLRLTYIYDYPFAPGGTHYDYVFSRNDSVFACPENGQLGQ